MVKGLANAEERAILEKSVGVKGLFETRPQAYKEPRTTERDSAMKKNKKHAAAENIAAETVTDIAPEAIASLTPDYREELVTRAKAAKQAALVGLITQEEADEHWARAEAACKPSEESLANVKTAKENLRQAETVLKAAYNALAVGLIDEDAVESVQAKTNAAKAAYSEAVKAAKGFSFGAVRGSGGPRYKGQMSGLDAAHQILSESDVPLNAVTIAKAAMERGLWCPDGLTPVATLSGALQTDCKKGDRARFTKVGAGLYTVRR